MVYFPFLGYSVISVYFVFQLTFYFIRHGKTVWNKEGLMQGHGDSPLTEEGVNGAKKTGVALNHIPFIAAYSSVLNRTIATASHIIGERDIPLFHHQGLNEQYFGSWEGKVVDTLREHPEFKQLIKDPANYKAQVNGGETLAVFSFFMSIKKIKEAETSLIMILTGVITCH